MGKRTIKAAWRWTRQTAVWISQAGLFLVAAAVVFGALFLAYQLHSELANRVVGVSLQILGLATTGIGIRDTRRLFGKPTLLETIRRWLRALPSFRPKAFSAKASSSIAFGDSAEATLWRGRGDGSPEARIKALEENLEELRGIVNKKVAGLDQENRLLRQDLQVEVDARAAGDRELHTLMKSATTDGLWLAIVGLVWIAIGIGMATFSVELARLSSA